MEKIEQLFSIAIKKRDQGLLPETRQSLKTILKNYPDHPKLVTVHMVLGGVLSDLGDYKESIYHFKKVVEEQPGSEMASLGIYLCLVELEQYNEAIKEMERFLSAHRAELYRTTLLELIEDLRNGYARDHEAVILWLARKNDVSIFDR